MLLSPYLLAEITWANPASKSQRTVPRSKRPEMAPFSWVDDYNFATTRQPVICQFEKNVSMFIIAILAKQVKAGVPDEGCSSA